MGRRAAEQTTGAPHMRTEPVGGKFHSGAQQEGSRNPVKPTALQGRGGPRSRAARAGGGWGRGALGTPAGALCCCLQ